MMEFFRSGGMMMWPLLTAGLGILYLAARTAVQLRRRSAAADVIRRQLQGILFWGAMSVLLGVVGTAGGFVNMAQVLAGAGHVEPRLLWGGVSLALVTLVVGLLIFLFAAMLWFVLRQWHERSAASPMS